MRRIATFVWAAVIACSMTGAANGQLIWLDGNPIYGYSAYPGNSGYYVPGPSGYAYPYGYTYPSYGAPLPGSSGLSYPRGTEGYYANRGFPYRRWSGDRSVVYPYDPGVLVAP